MATMEELEQALRNAHNAGDDRAARAFAGEIRKMRDTQARSEFDQLPWWAKAAQAADDQARNFANAITLGFADRLSAGLSDNTLGEERQKSADASARAGGAGVAMDVLGLLMPGAGASRAAGTIAKGSGLPTTMLREGVAGSAVGTGMAIGEGESISDGALVGALGGAAGGAAGKYIGEGIDYLATKAGNIMPGFLSSVRTPRKTMDEMYTAKDAAYQAVDDAGIRYSPQQMQGLVKDMTKRLKDADMDSELHKTATRRARKLRNRVNRRTKSPTSLKEIDTQRQLINRDVRGSGGEDEMGRIMRTSIDDFVESTKPRNSSSERAARLIGDARESSRRLKVRKGVEDTIERARNTTIGESNVAPFRSLLNRGTKGMTKEEAKALKRIVRGEGAEQSIAKLLEGTAGKVGTVGSGAAAGAMIGGVPGATAMGLGSLFLPSMARRGAQSYTKKNIEELLDLLGGGKVDEATLRQILRMMGGVTGGAAAGDQFRRQREARGRPLEITVRPE